MAVEEMNNNPVPKETACIVTSNRENETLERNVGKCRRARQREEEDLLKRLRGTLSDMEIERVLASALLELDEVGRDRLAQRLGEDTGGTLQVLFETPRGERPRVGKAKTQQEWDRAWEAWWECIFESGIEEGRYVRQDEHWEPPYLDTSAVLEDLEGIASKIKPLIARVMEQGLDPDFSFAEMLAQADDEIGSGLPEWLYVDDSHAFGPEVTSCLLEWECQAARQEGTGPFALLDSIRRLESSLRRTYLDRGPITTWAQELGKRDQKEILAGLQKHSDDPHWAGEMERPHSGWFQIKKALAEQWDPALYAATCRANIAGDWKLALPLLKGLLKRKMFTEARTIIDEAVRALLRLDHGERWNPCQGLLLQHPELRYYHGQISARAELLRSWQRVAKATGDTDLAAVLDLQAVVTRHWEDWDRTVEAFHKLEQSGVPAATRERLLVDWRLRVADASLTLPTDEDTASLASRWVHRLIDAAIVGDDGKAFHKAVKTWLSEISESPAMRDCRPSLSTLTLDLDRASVLKETAPKLHQLLAVYANGRSRLVRSRRRCIERLQGPGLLSDVLAFWKQHALSLIPDPAHAHRSRYYHHAEWMAAMLDLDREVYTGIIDRWSADHRRRRNLWKALREEGLPLPGQDYR